MRIVFLDSGKEWRGGQYQVLNLGLELQRRGHELLLVCQKRTPLHLRAKEKGLPVEAVRMRGDLDFKAWVRVAGILRMFKPELLHAHTGRGHAVGLGATFFQDVNAFVVTRRVGTPLRINVLNRVKYSRLVSCFVAISEHVAETLKLAGVPPARIRVIPSGVRLEEFEVEGGETEVGRADGTLMRTVEPVVLNVGSLSKEKSQQDVLRVASVVARAVPSVRFLIAGDGPMRHRLERISRDLGVDSVVRLLGFREDVAALMRAASVFLFPSESEGLGSAALQAMAAGLPVVATDSGGIRDVVSHGETGFLFAKRDVASMADAVVKLLGDKDLADRMGANARRKAADFSFQRCCASHEELYKELLG
ncbi:MAG: glycosyltransferase family 4 protein [Candidatus Eisenbacteria bacterium]|nr:glycosyltransferase family 4 protein [Candidatus Eisenbacteria bacterium]